MFLKLEKVSYSYKGGTPFENRALKEIDLEIREGEFLGLAGPTGSGKTTLIQHLNGLLTPTEGKVYINGGDLRKVNLKQLRRRISLLFQYPEDQLFAETVEEDILFGPSNFGMKGVVKDALEAVGLDYEEFRDRSPLALSHGEKRRVAIAGVLALEPELLILDEPTQGLDPQGKEEILRRIEELHRKKGMTIILVSQEMDDLARLSDRVVIMNQGEIVLCGSPREVFGRVGILEGMGLEVPYAVRLMKRLKERGLEVPTDILTMEKAKREILKLFRRAKFK